MQRRQMRRPQEAALGIGGYARPAGHGNPSDGLPHERRAQCFAGIERLAQVMSSHGVDLKTAWEIVSRTNVFTTHTPVLAGHDEFPVDLVRPYLDHSRAAGVKTNEILSWVNSGAQPNGPLSMFVLGMRLSKTATA
jgi:starch phosphorylase